MTGKMKLLLGLLTGIAAGVVVVFSSQSHANAATYSKDHAIDNLKDKYSKMFEGESHNAFLFDKPEGAELLDQVSTGFSD